MKMSTAVQYVLAENEKFKFVACTFDTSSTRYTYKTTLDVEVGDILLVETNAGLAKVVVRDILDITDVDLDAYEYKWVVQKVDFTYFEQCKEAEAAVLKVLREKQRRHVAKQAVDGLLTDDEHEQVKALVRL